MNKTKKSRCFFLRLAFHNVIHNRQTYLPYLLATSVIFSACLLIAGLSRSQTLSNMPTGGTAVMMLSMGLIVFDIFAFCFMVYINNFLISRRKKEFGLYAVLGLEKRHVSRVLIWENTLMLLAGLAIGCILALVLGQLLFWILLKLIHAAPGSTFSISADAFGTVLVLFALVFIVTSLVNLIQVRRTDPLTLMQAQKKGEKESRLLWPLAVLGAILLIGTYYFAWSIDIPAIALGLFFPLALLVILATYILFSSGSVAILKGLRANKRFYYKPRHFITVSGLIQRMKQNARGLASICILSTMLIVTISFTLSLYMGQEEILQGSFPYDVSVHIEEDASDASIKAFEGTLLSLAEKNGVTLSADPAGLTGERNPNGSANNYVPAGARRVALSKLLYADDSYRFDVEGSGEACEAFIGDIYALDLKAPGRVSILRISDIYTDREEGYGLYGGLLFMGAFFALLFLSITVLQIYFKQVTEGYEDKERFVMLQKVGMDDRLVKSTINSQVLYVFFVPLAATVLHMLFASRIITCMLQTFKLGNLALVLACTGGSLAVFALIYLLIYRLTARVYYKIVKW